MKIEKSGAQRMRTASAPAFAKINLFLDVREKRADGYHDLASVMQRISLHDDVTVTSRVSGVSVGCDGEGLSGEGNIAFSAAKAFFEASGVVGGAAISIKKRIPISAGLGGGSSDAAAVICLLNEIYGSPLDGEKLLRVGFSVGADVPFFAARCKAALVYGAGESVTPCEGLTNCSVLIAKDGEKESTGEMYRRLDLTARVPRSERDLAEALRENNAEKTGKNLYNSFEAVSTGSDAARGMMRDGAIGVCLCGSGPCVFGIYKDKKAAEAAARRLASAGITAFLTEPV